MDLGLRDRACIVTGASRGIGRAVAVSLAGEGASVLLVGRRSDALAEVAHACAGCGEPLAIDVTAVDAGERAVQACLERFGRLDALVNGAGTSAVRPLEDLTDEEWQGQWELHVMGPMRLMRAAAPAMAERGWGRIVNVASSSGKRPSSTNMAYSVTKAAELSLSRAFADLWAGHGVLVNSVSPGPIGGDLWLAPGGLADQNAQARGISREQVLESTGARVPLGRMGTDAEIAAVIVFLCSEPASNVAGAAWSVDGGAVPVIISAAIAMGANSEAIGKSYPATVYAVGREKVREYAYAVGETNPLYLDVEAARAAGHADVVAPPMFAVVYAGRAITPALFDPEVGINFANMLHAGQEFEWGPLVVAGDEITTTAEVKDISERGGMGFYDFETVSRNHRGETVCTGTWRQIVRGVSS